MARTDHEAEIVDWVTECVAPLGIVTSRRMMGGNTLYCDGVAFAIVAFDQLWFKGDVASDAEWDEAGCEKFSYKRNGTIATMNYRLAPAEVYDDPDALRQWAALGIGAGQRARAKKKPHRKKGN